MAVQVGELEGLVIDQDQDRLRRGKEGVEAVLGGNGLGHGRHSGLRVSLFGHWMSPVYCSMTSH